MGCCLSAFLRILLHLVMLVETFFSKKDLDHTDGFTPDSNTGAELDFRVLVTTTRQTTKTIKNCRATNGTIRPFFSYTRTRFHGHLALLLAAPFTGRKKNEAKSNQPHETVAEGFLHKRRRYGVARSGVFCLWKQGPLA
ncbi:hypothetical protein QBC38DRAFT_66162 [Podospora fimiseda]|uniref:Secreted protein n=1 Tax=Podospora fimiseda TaxID=252190 RepID=A0AAN7BEI5_9PEZI|nr:hypothetical protein QBC38DRAFT_66162 [Podospora fimiseda]